MAELDAEARTDLSDADYGVVRGSGEDKVRKFPIPDEAHGRNALARMNQSDLTPEEKRTLVSKIRRKFPNIEVSEDVLRSVGLKKSDQTRVLSAVVFDKGSFSRPTVEEWARRNLLSLARPIETAQSITLFQKDSEKVPQPIPIAPGITALFVEEDAEELDAFIPFAKVDEEKRIVYGEVYVPYLVDTQGDFALPEDIEKAAHDFMIMGLLGNIDTEHDFVPNGCRVVESWVAKAGDPLFTPGSWVVGTKILNDTVWQKIKKGDLNGYSMAGRGKRVYDEDKQYPLIYKNQDATTEKTEKTKPTRLTDMGIRFITVTKKGANRRDWKILKADSIADYVPIYKSFEQRLADKEIGANESRITDIILKTLRNFFFGDGSHPGRLVPPTPPERKEQPMPGQEQKANLSFEALAEITKAALERTAAFEACVLGLIAKSPEMTRAVENDPVLKAMLSNFNAEDIKAVVQKAMGVAFLMAPSSNVVKLPVPVNFFGARLGTVDFSVLQSQGANPGGITAGSPSAGGVMMKAEDIQKEVDGLKAKLAQIEASSKADPEIKTALADLQKSLTGLKAQVDTMAMATKPIPPSPPPPGAASDPNFTKGKDTTKGVSFYGGAERQDSFAFVRTPRKN